jgi:hypothetical protein
MKWSMYFVHIEEIDWNLNLQAYKKAEGHYCIYESEHSLSTPEDGESMFLRNVSIFPQVHTVLQTKRSKSTQNCCRRPRDIEE